MLSPWVYGACEHTQENRDRYFTPGQMQLDVRWAELNEEDPREIWKDFDDLSSDDTHYAGRGQKHYRTMWSGNEVLMANDNEIDKAFSDGSINVLMGSGAVRQLIKTKELKEHWDEDDPDFVMRVGPDSPVEILQKLKH